MILDDDQVRLENTMLADANNRRAKDNTKSTARSVWSESKLGTKYTRSATADFAVIIKAKLDAYVPGQPRLAMRALKLLADTKLKPEVIAHLFVKTIFQTMPMVHRKRLKRVTLCMKAAEFIHDEVRIKFFASEKHRRALLKKLFKTFDKRTYPRHWRKRTIRNYFHSEQLDWNLWSPRERLLIGYTLLVWFRDGTGLVDAPKLSPYVDPSADLIEHVQAAMRRTPLDYMLYKPMVVKPRPWAMDNLFRGGYLTDGVKTYPIVKRTGRKDAAEMQEQDWSQIIPALNALQETRWHVNKPVLNVLKWVMDVRRDGLADLPMSDPVPLPPEPAGYRDDEEVRKAHNRKCFLIHSDNRELISKRLAVMSCIAVAEQYKRFDAIHFPHNMDSRGRAYPLPVFLNPQGPDYCKALLEFADALPIDTQEQACWLAIVGANAYGNDKVSLQERVDWVADNEEMILSIANDPYTDVRWSQGGDPFQFLRFCFEWKGFTEAGFGFMSNMVTYVDATNSGCQHYSAMLLDEVGGRAVNLVPGLPRQDIYQDVADLVIEKCMTETEDRETAKNIISLGISRKDTKKQVMVVPYSGTFSSCMSYTREAIRDRAKSGIILPWNADDMIEDQRHVSMLSKDIWQSIDEVVIKAKEAMTWLTAAARAHVKHMNSDTTTKAHEKAMSWVTPDGFVVKHYRADVSRKQIETYLDGRVQLVLHLPNEKLSSKDTAQAVAPNLVHSLDACLLRASVIKGLAKGITSYGMIHDSFGVHAHHMGTFLKDCVKPAFIGM